MAEVKQARVKGKPPKEDVPPFWTVDKGGAYTVGRREEDFGAEVPAGTYTGAYADGRYYLIPSPLVTDHMVRVPASVPDVVLASIGEFYASESKYRQHGLVFKRGILLEGDAGGGKTAICNMVVADFVARGGVGIVSAWPPMVYQVIQVLREVEPGRRALAILEDIDQVVLQGDEDELLSLLDGQKQFDGVVFLATTNHIERLPPRIKNRPSRFDEVIHVGMPDYTLRLAYLRSKLEPEGTPLAKMENWAVATDGLSIAHLKEFVIAVVCLGRPVEQTLARLREMGTEAR